MSCYFIAQIEIEDNEEYARYLAGYDAIFERYEGVVVAVDDEVETLEGSWPYGRTVLIRFPSKDALNAWYRSAEYQALAEHRRRASRGNLVAVRGREDTD